MDWINNSPNFIFLEKKFKDFEPSSIDEERLKMSVGWLLSTVKEQGKVLSSIDKACTESGANVIPFEYPKPNLKVIEGGKIAQ